MKAIVRRQYGDTGQVRLEEVPDPVAASGEVLVEVAAAGLDRGVWHLMTGRPLVARLAFGLRAPRQPVLGRDLAGVVRAVGPGVEGFAVGDRVLGTSATGTFAELAVARADRIVPMPDDWSFEDAAAVPVSGLTAEQAVHGLGRVGPGMRVLVLGASGGVGSFAVQMAAHVGAEVDAVCSEAKADLVRGLGAGRVLPYRSDGDDLPAGTTYDVIIDIGGHRRVRALRRSLTPRGTLVIVGSETSGALMGGTQRQMGAALRAPFTRHRMPFLLAGEAAADLQRLVDLGVAGAYTPVVERTFPLVDTAAAIDHLAAGRARGKVVVTV
jgi:NADPH:quinone reductase-like Zn-dependent oxidoreductase